MRVLVISRKVFGDGERGKTRDKEEKESRRFRSKT